MAQVPFKIPEDAEGLSIMFFNAEREGYLKKEGGSKKTWRTRWVVLKDSCIYYFKEKDDASPCGIVPLAGVQVRLAQTAQEPTWVPVALVAGVRKGWGAGGCVADGPCAGADSAARRQSQSPP